MVYYADNSPDYEDKIVYVINVKNDASHINLSSLVSLLNCTFIARSHLLHWGLPFSWENIPGSVPRVG